ncbi:UDP-N-acetylmuramoyl-L-alanine--D-glutamate ligase [Corynebacterium sp. BF-R-2]|uniref:UDP-N-acetylmuramoyl-L-alanine--D-glutamate ligase n=1 Tax=Corynebacterium sp. BF-R-2 TaxID=2943494 RepID=UPI00211E0D4F|nr:UDP-N-acetylmuramoyl-L-alanine--D-glutamate ligase [Corynebacterium sp. BF-R-2]MCQ9675646.1 UDP-N-acetylmuramoyl-L-alanine--D-glutamate ligase [Corynebacterium sp. BF-R-2]
MSPRPEFLDGRVLIAGAGVSGRGCAAVLAGLGVDITVADGNAESRARIESELGVATADTDAVALDEYSFVVTSPGWRPDSPLLARASDAGLEVIGDVELAYRLDRAEVFGVPRRWLAITGTNGKTTTTGMLAAIMAADERRSGLRSQAVGNIGVSPFDALAAEPRVDILVAELSSFQLHWSSELRPEVGALLNLADDHLDWHGSFEAYAADKARILTGTHSVYGKDDEHVVALVGDRNATAFSHTEPALGDVGVRAGGLFINGVAGMTATVVDDVTTLQPAGLAGVLDAAAAAAVAALAGARAESITEGLASYVVAGHRGEIVHEHAGVTYIDNSKATNPHAAEVAMRGLDSVVWVAGGQLKGSDVSELLRTHAARLKAAVLVGVDKHLLAQALTKAAPHVPIVLVDSHDPQAAMDNAVAAALQHADTDDTVLLAPAAASLDMYTGMSQRGDMFAAAARRLAR